MQSVNRYVKWLGLWILFLTILTNIGCRKLVTVTPPISSITGENVFSSNSTAAAVLTGIYTTMSAGTFITGQNSITTYSGLSADEFTLLSGTGAPDIYYYTNALTSINTGYYDLWSNIYPIIYIANAAIQGLTNNKSLTPAVQQQLMGEALFVRAFCYFYLVNLYGDVPLVIGTNYTVNDVLPQTPQTQVWQQIVTDLKNAQTFLSRNYLGADAETPYTPGAEQKVRPTSWAADALLARVYLYTSDWADAAIQADSVIENASLFSLDTLNGVFLANSNEAIWQLQPVTSGTTNTQEAAFFIPQYGPPTVYLSPWLLNSFEAGDQRRLDWVDSAVFNNTLYYFPYKYKVYQQNAPVTEYLMVFRLGEQYLIRAEAEANGAPGGVAAAVADLNVIRTRAGLLPYSGAFNSTSVLNAIYHERQIELFSEWGNRWLDLKRTDNVNSVLGSPENVCQAKGGTWNPDWQLYPIILTELQYDPNLVQNPGYN